MIKTKQTHFNRQQQQITTKKSRKNTDNEPQAIPKGYKFWTGGLCNDIAMLFTAKINGLKCKGTIKHGKLEGFTSRDEHLSFEELREKGIIDPQGHLILNEEHRGLPSINLIQDAQFGTIKKRTSK